MKFYTQISMTQQYNMLNINSDLFSIQKFIIHFHPSPKDLSAKWHDETSRVQLQSYSLTTLENNEKLHPYKFHVRAWTHSGEAHCDQTDLLGNLDKADVEIPAWEGLRRSLRSGPCACRELCPKSHPSSIFKLTRAFVLLPPLFWKYLDQTLKLLLVFATRYLHVFQVNKWSDWT